MKPLPRQAWLAAFHALFDAVEATREALCDDVPTARGSDVQAVELPPVKPKRAPRRGGGGRRIPRPYVKPTKLEQVRAARTVEP